MNDLVVVVVVVRAALLPSRRHLLRKYLSLSLWLLYTLPSSSRAYKEIRVSVCVFFFGVSTN